MLVLQSVVCADEGLVAAGEVPVVGDLVTGAALERQSSLLAGA